MLESKTEGSFHTELRQQRARLVVRDLVRAVRRPVARRQPPRRPRMSHRPLSISPLYLYLRQEQVDVRALQHVPAALGDDQRLLRPGAAPPSFRSLPVILSGAPSVEGSGVRASSHRSRARSSRMSASKSTRLIARQRASASVRWRSASSEIAVARAQRRAQQPVGADVVAFVGMIDCFVPFVRQFQRAAGECEPPPLPPPLSRRGRDRAWGPDSAPAAARPGHGRPSSRPTT